MPIKFCHLALFLCFCPALSARAITVTGKVSDVQGQGLAAANVVVFSLADSSNVVYSNTDREGNYTISVPDSAGEVFIRASYLGYTAQDKRIDPNLPTQQIDFVLERAAEILPPTVIRGRMLGAKIKGDTIAYNLEKYTDGTEQTLRDILQKLPGIDVDENGEVSAQGKKIDKLLIDGKEFFLNQSQMATRNLPAKLVEGVDLINNYNDISMLGDSKPQGISALNISIREEHKGRITGTLTGAGGVNTKYSAKANLFRFDKNLGAAFIGDIGNTGEMAFTLEDYIKFQSGGIMHLMRNSVANISTVDLSNIPTASFSEEVRSKPGETGAVNLSYQPNEKLKINSYFIGNHQTQEGAQSLNRKTVNGAGGYTDVYNNQLSEKNNFLFTNLYLSGDYKPSKDLFISNRFMFGTQNRNHKSDIVNFQLNVADTFLSKERISPVDLKNYFLLLYNTKGGGLLSVDAYYRYYGKPSNLELASGSPFLGLPLQAPAFDEAYRAVQDNRQSAREFMLQADFTRNLFKKVIIKPKLGISYSSQNLNTLLLQRNDGRDYYFLPENDFANNIGYNNLDVNGGLYLLKNFGIFRCNIGLNGHYHLTSEDNGRELRKSEKCILLPFLQASVYFSTAHYITIAFNPSEQMRRIDDLAKNKVVTNYRSIGQSSITDYLYSKLNASLRYTLTNFRKNMTLYITLTYDKLQQPSAYNYISHTRYSELFIRETDGSQNLFSSVRFRKGLGNSPFEIGIKLKSRHFFTTNFISGAENRVTTHNVDGELSLASFRQGAVNGELGSEFVWRRNISKLADRTTELLTLAPFGKIRVKFNSEWFATSSLRYQRYDAEDIKRSVTYLDAVLHYSPSKSRVEFELSAVNILNLNKTERVALVYRENFFEERIYQTLPGFCLLKMIYRI